jgi:hypothetical protein
MAAAAKARNLRIIVDSCWRRPGARENAPPSHTIGRQRATYRKD